MGERQLRPPVKGACSLRGPDGKTLLLCSAPDFAEENRKVKREAVLFTTQVEVPAP